jgi:hypothetical protein
VKEDEVGGTCRTQREMKNTYKILVGKPELKRGVISVGLYARMLLK